MNSQNSEAFLAPPVLCGVVAFIPDAHLLIRREQFLVSEGGQKILSLDRVRFAQQEASPIRP